MKISASLIVKNEEDHLEHCLNSIQGVDEIVIVDTGSIDKTVELAKSYTDKVYSGPEYTWTDNFAYHRNQSLELCTGDWILIIDGDEFLEIDGIEKLRKQIKEIKTGKTGLRFDTISSTNKNAVHKSIRAFERNGVKWEGAAHNYLTGVDPIESDIKLYYGYSNAHKLDPDRTFRILKKTVEDYPSLARERYYLAREYYYRKNYHAARREFQEYLKKSSFLAEKADAHLYIARCQWFLNQGSKARESCIEAIKINPDFKEALLFMSELHFEPWKTKWKFIADNSTNNDVLFIR